MLPLRTERQCLYWKDPTWATFNDPEFKYGNGGAADQKNAGAYYLTHPQRGFINEYSTAALEEDNAEIFAALFVPAEYEKLKEWMKTDTILANKVAYLKAFLQQQCPQMNDDFWNHLHSEQ